MGISDGFALVGAIVGVVAPIAGLVWYIMKHPDEWKEIFLASIITLLVITTLLVGVAAAAGKLSPVTLLVTYLSPITAVPTLIPTIPGGKFTATLTPTPDLPSDLSLV